MVLSKLRGVAPAFAALILLNLIVYGSVIGFSFTNFDDPDYVSRNPHVVSGVTAANVAWAFTSTTGSNWHPLTMLSHMIDARIYGRWAGGHHLTSLLLHTANTLFIFALLSRMTGAPGRSVFVAALFAVHPLHVESVAWIAERKDVLSTFFALLTIWVYAAYARAPAPGRYAAVALCFTLALLAKPMVVTLPCLLLLLDIWPLGRASLSPVRWAVWWPLLREKLVLLLLAAAESVITFNVQNTTGSVASFDRLSLGVRLGHALISYWTYIGQMCWPVRLTAFYPFEEATVTVWRATLAGLALAGVSAFAIRMARRRPYVLTGWFWYVGLLVPVIGLIQVGNQATADRYSYLPLVGLFIIAAWTSVDASARWAPARAALPIIAVVIVAGCAVTARTQVATWHDSRTLWTHALEVTPANYFAHGSLGAALVDDGDLENGIAHLNESLRLKQGLADVENDLGSAYAQQGKLNDATAHFAQAVRINPRFVEAIYNYGLALSRLDRLEEAAAQFAAAIGLRPDFTDAHINRGLVLARLGRPADAMRELQEGLRLNPHQPEVRCNLAVLYAQQGNSPEAKRQLEAALADAPGYPRAVRMLADLARNGR